MIIFRLKYVMEGWIYFLFKLWLTLVLDSLFHAAIFVFV